MGFFRKVPCPAKLNLYLGVTGRRDDNYHDIASLAVQLNLFDHLQIRLSEIPGDDTMVCDVPEIPTDHTNSVMKALGLFRKMYDFPYRVSVSLEKNIPIGSGLGGSGSDAAFFLKTLNEMLAFPISDADLQLMAAKVGSDVPLFLSSSPCIVKGRGDCVASVNPERLDGLRKVKILVFKPIFSMDSQQAYDILDIPGSWNYANQTVATNFIQNLLSAYESGTYDSQSYLNTFESIVAGKYTEIGLIFKDMPEYFKLFAHLTGTGSACFVLLREDYDVEPLVEYLCEVLGETAFIALTRPRLVPA
ncbi:MAG: 4-(cytidine 5'-diphospho)-2-C-methyl-D-erythritol kinase [Puniceicoccales bacterium]|nr:4-(cytidine 5'-diphospho)-2-C-methyl-D-erythritol kinase [Puniceicoccales bacterium]